MCAQSLRELAKSLNLSHATVSEALRGSTRVKAATRLRIEAAAEKLGYRRNPLASALMTELRRSRGGVFRGLIAALSADPSVARSATGAHYQAEILAGAAARAAELGFKIDELVVGRTGCEPERLPVILHARGIRGVLLLPSAGAAEVRHLEWGGISALCADQEITSPRLNAIRPDHDRALALVRTELRARGYRRPGLVLETTLGPRLLQRWKSAFHAYPLDNYGPDVGDADDADDAPRSLVVAPGDEGAFRRWFADGGFDVILAPDPAVREWLRRAAADRVEDPGFCCLNRLDPASPCAGLDLRPRSLGHRAAELLIEQVMRNEHGEPELPTTSIFDPLWVDGPSLRQSRETASADPFASPAPAIRIAV